LRLRAALLVALATFALVPSQASAHALVVALDPSPGAVLSGQPTLVRITFSEPVTPFGVGIDIYAPDGRRVSGTTLSQGTSLLAPLGEFQHLPPGTYLVEWRVVAQDTHPSRGSYTFSVGHPSAIPTGEVLTAGDLGAASPLGLLLQSLGRWLHFLGYAASFGVLAFQLLVVRADQLQARLRPLVFAGIALLLAAEPVALLGQVASLGPIDGQFTADVLGSPFGRVLALRLGAALLLWGMLGALRESRGRGAWSVLLLGVLLALVDGLAGHTIRGAPAPFAQLLTAVHLAAMGVWVGGFAGLLAVIGGSDDRSRLVARFGRLALVAVGLLVASGLVLALAHLRGPADLLFTAYGLTLVIKSAVVAVALGGAYFGLRAARSGRAEAAALAGVLLVAALLASLPPPR
jgi:copper transport protein